ncbi:MAG: T9SS type A sorting domain-containing protein [Rhodothermia bacterium]|nr:T9SS type A sorting domain-containing protein [Rhodothermia bacterium]
MKASYWSTFAIAAVASIALLATSPADAQTVDLFTAGPQSVNSVVTSSNANGGVSVIGTFRNMIFTAGTIGSSAAMSVPGTGTATFTRGADDSWVAIDWDGDNDPLTFDATGLGGLDLTTGGANAFQFNITANRSANFEARMLVHTDGSNASSVDPISTGGTGLQTICYSSFSAIAGGGADFTNVGAIQFDTAIGSNAQDWDIGAITYVTSGGCGLPVELSEFDAVIDGSSAHVSWQTASEQSTLGFGLEHRSSLTETQAEWREVAFLPAAGESSALREYAFTIDALPSGQHELRLRIVDLDGSFNYSESIEVAVESPESFRLGAAYPNPFNPSTSVTLSVQRSQNVDIALFDLLGRRVLDVYRGAIESGAVQTFNVDASSLSTGLYMIRASGEYEIRSSAVMLVK